MRNLSEQIIQALMRVKQVGDARKAHIIHSLEITRADREILTRAHWLQEIMRG